MFDQFEDSARRVVDLAREEAKRFNFEYIGTEHLLPGLILEGGDVATKVLRELEIDLNEFRRGVKEIVRWNSSMTVVGELPFTPSAKSAFKFSAKEAERLGHDSIRPAHLLLGLLQVNEGIAVQVLINLGIEISQLREETLECL